MSPQSAVPPRPPRAPRARWLLSAFLVGSLLASCKQEPASPPPAATPSTSPGTADATKPGTPPVAALMRTETLTPVIHELASENSLPEGIVVEFSRPVRPGSESVLGSVLTISPPVAGSLSWTGPSSLRFTPAASGFTAGATYTVSVDSVGTDAGVVKPPSERAWRYNFTTYAFKFVQVVPTRMDLTKGVVELSVTFSGPVDLAAVRSRSSFRVGDAGITDVKWTTRADTRNSLAVTLTHPKLRAAAIVQFALRDGLAQAGAPDTRAPAANASFPLAGGKRTDITYVSLEEGANGYFFEVSCRDVEADASPSPVDERWDSYYYDDDNRGCTLSDAVAAEALRFKPKVKFTVAPSRRGFRIFGDFKRGPHTLSIAEGTPTVGGGTFLGAFSRGYSVPARAPQVRFSTSGRYLPRSAWKNLPLQHLNLEEVTLTVRNVPPENLVYWMSDDSDEKASERTSNVLLRKDVPLKSTPDSLLTTYVDVASLVPSTTRGLVEITAERGDYRAASRILLTDLSLVAKKGGPAPGSKDSGEVWVWALGLESTEPLSGVEVSLVKKSGQTVARCTTQGDSGCQLKVPAPDADDSVPFALVARKGDELTYLKYDELKTEIANSDVQGEPYRAEQPYRASLWSDRGVYRPGDTAHVAAVLRGQDNLAPPVGMPVEVRVIDPREREIRKETLKTNAAGLVSLDQTFAAFQDTGRYSVRLKIADREVASYGLSVEEFVPERMKVTAATEAPGYKQGAEIPVAVEAAYLFGGSAEGSPVEMTCRLESAPFKPKQNGQYTYGIWRQDGNEPRPVTLGQVKGTLDAKGQALLKCPAQAASGPVKGASRLSAVASVFESGSGRATIGEANVPVHPEAYYLGLQANTQKVKASTPFTVSGVVVDWNGQLVADGKGPKTVELEYQLLEENYGYYYDEESGYERYQRYLRPQRDGQLTAKVEGGRFTATVTPGRDGAGYLVRARAGATQSDLALEGDGRYYWWGEGSRVDQTPRPMKPTALELSLPAKGKVGEALTVKVKAPYRGRVLFTVETDRVLFTTWKQAEPGEVSWSFTPTEYAPNVYVSAFLVKDPHLESAKAFMPDRAFGVGSISLEPVDFTQAVTLTVPKEVRSNDTLTVDLALEGVEGPTFATVAVVDEGILSLTRFQSPDPLKEIFTRRALGIQTFETVGWALLVPPGGNSSSTGGDEGGAAGRVQPVKPVALWSGVVEVPASGKLRVPFKLPQYRGAVRVMVVTAGNKRIGRASAQVLVRDPLVLQTTLPRFLTQNDDIQIPVFVTNLSGKAQDVKVTLAAEALAVPGMAMPADVGSPLKLSGKNEGRARLEDGKSRTFVFQGRAVQSVGAARLIVTVEGGGYTSREQLDVPLSPAGPRERRIQQVELAQGTTDLGPLLQGWVPTTERTTVWVTNNPYAKSLQHLSYLVRYPYGCIEQTTSSTRPLLYVSQLVERVDPTLVSTAKVEDMVQSGINRVLSMQTSSGGFAYWPGSQEPVGWGTAYATHMLLDARKLKYPVPEDRLESALTWLGNELTQNEGKLSRDDHYGHAEPYMHYVLAAAGKGRKARVQALVTALETGAKKKPLTGEELEDQYMLKAALWLSGDRRYEKDLRGPDLSPVTDERKNNWSFYSDRRRRGMLLSTFQDLFGDAPEGEPLARMVATALQTRSSAYYSTQELVWGITGLGKRLQGTATSFTAPTLMAGGKAVAASPEKDARVSDRTWSLARASERTGLSVEMKDKGTGSVYLIVNSEGVRTTPEVKVGGQGLTLKRTWHSLDGTALDLKSTPVKLADLIYVQLEVTNTTGERIQNIALVDRLPAGWEIENARLGRGGSVDWVSAEEQWAPDYVNVRDDRMEVFGALQARETKKVVYAVRAVTAGSFTLPSAEAEAMYDSETWARESAGTVQVVGPWKDDLL
ncbi:MG2 domain-containing protein [Corallococcus sp. bb12-1]|uniref:Ig-like domain-containing alpha-2-macroglobulin family protein n=1 Tax=Corallococcus sp. bb12-1 TaxID=2996784 RepID=UPI002270D734|nr:Ig-like domain-containing alpha-2-macroglobulin family protein [Corallococcus sp. bb12-1]MCY1045141.1 MG2 domain-containing protein [Corallococcus sp. bb12-1]